MATSFVEKLLKQLRETGDILPKPHAGGPKPKLNEAQLNLVKALVEADNDATLDQLRQRLADETSVSISRATMGRILQQLGLTREKKHSTTQRRRVQEYNKPGSTTGNASKPSLRKT